MPLRIALPLAVAWAAVFSFAQAHGPQIQVTGDTGQIVTRRMFADGPYHPLKPVTRIYVIPVEEVGGNWFVKPPTATTSGPGFAVGLGYDMDPGNHPFQTGDYKLKFADSLLKWNGAAFEDAGVAQLRTNKGTTTADSTDAGPFEALTWSITVADSEAHSGMTYRFLGDGNSPSSALDNGIYLLSLQLSHGTLVDSDPFYYVMPKGASLGDAATVADYLANVHSISSSAVQVVPEPTTIVLALMGVASWRRRRKS